MKRPNLLKQIKDAVQSANKDKIFVPADFYSITEPVRVGVCLKRLCESGELTRIMRRVYVKQGCASPGADDIARAIARSYGWNVFPCDETALYLSGLSDAAPAKWTYLSDGRYKTYIHNNHLISFKRSEKICGLVNASNETALLIQALRAVGKGNVTDETIIKLANIITVNAISKIRYDANKTTAWIKKYIEKICDEALLQASGTSSETKMMYEKDLKYKTLLGHRVRSKSEAIIAYSLNMAGLKYVYEKPLYDKYKKNYVPDFTIYYRGNEYYLEHIGMMDDVNYAIGWYKKEKWYNDNFPGKLLTTIDYPYEFTVDENKDIGSQIKKILYERFAFGSV